MPKGTKVDKVFRALKRQGKGEGQAGRIAQAVTGLSLKTGKPPRPRRKPIAMSDDDEGIPG